GRPLADGFCRTSWRQENGGFSPLLHCEAPTGQHIERRLGQALDLVPSDLDPSFYREVARAHVAAIAEPVPPSGVLHFRGYFDNDTGQPLRATLTVRAPDEVAIVVNGLPIEEAILSTRPLTEYHDDVLLPPGRNELVVFHHRFEFSAFGPPGNVTLASVDGSGHPLAWQCDVDFSSATDHGR